MAVTIMLYISVIVGRSKVDSTSLVAIYFFLVKCISLVFFMVNLLYILPNLLMK